MCDDLVFDLDEMTFNRLVIDKSIAIEFADTTSGQSIMTEGSFILREASGDVTRFDVRCLSGIDILMALLDRPLSHCIAKKEGTLSVMFVDGASVFMERDPMYESWHLYLEEYTIHSIAGGSGYAIFDKQ